MVSQRGQGRSLKQQITNRVAEILDRDETKSRTAIVKQLRSEGFKFANDRIRAEIQGLRTHKIREGGFAGVTRDGNIVKGEIRISEHDFPTTRQFKLAIQTFVSDETQRIQTRTQDLLNKSRFVVTWQARLSYEIHLHGDFHSSGNVTRTGKFTHQVKDWNFQDLESRVEQQLIAIILKQKKLGDKYDSIPQSVDFIIKRFKFDILKTELR